MPPAADTPADMPPEGARDAGLRRRAQSRMRDEMARAVETLAAVRHELAGRGDSDVAGYEERLALLLGRRLEEVEGAVAVAFELADRTGAELREELETATHDLTEQVEAVAAMARAAAAAPETSNDLYALDARFDEVHRRIDAVTRELRAGELSLARLQAPLPSPYGQRLEATLGRRLESVEGALEVASSLVERTGSEIRDELADVAAAGELRRRALAQELAGLADRLDRIEDDLDGGDLASLVSTWRSELHAVDVQLGEELVALRAEIRRGGNADPKTELLLRELIHRIEIVEGDRNAITAQLVNAAESWAAERVALQERVAELAARIVTGPVPAGPGDGEHGVWPSARAFDQLRISVEGLRMRLAHHEKSVAELAKARSVDDRLDDMQLLLSRWEGSRTAVERESVVDQLEQIATRMESRLQHLGAEPRR